MSAKQLTLFRAGSFQADTPEALERDRTSFGRYLIPKSVHVSPHPIQPCEKCGRRVMLLAVTPKSIIWIDTELSKDGLTAPEHLCP
jgi:hypothetical protein